MTELIFPIIASAASEYDVTIEDILSRSRRRDVTEARHMAMLIAREKLGLTYPHLGALFDRKHSAVIIGTRVLKDHMSVYKRTRQRYEKILANYEKWIH